MDGSSILDIGRHQDGDGSPLTLIRCDHPAALVAVAVAGAHEQRIYLARRIAGPDVARVIRHVMDMHLADGSEGVCWAPACLVAAGLMRDSDVDLRPAIASSA